MAGNTADKTTIRSFLKKIEELHGKAERIWVMDRGIPTRRCWPGCEPAIRRCAIWWARPRGG
jgi:hypothetical protein